MGVNISVASPLPDGVSLQNFNGSWRVKPSRIATKIYTYTLPAPTASGTDIVISAITARPTMDFTNNLYYVKIDEFTLNGASNITELGIFSDDSYAISNIGPGTASLITNTTLVGKIFYTTNTGNTNARLDMVTGQTFVPSGLRNTENSFRIVMSTARIINTLTFSIYEVNLL